MHPSRLFITALLFAASAEARGTRKIKGIRQPESSLRKLQPNVTATGPNAPPEEGGVMDDGATELGVTVQSDGLKAQKTPDANVTAAGANTKEVKAPKAPKKKKCKKRENFVDGNNDAAVTSQITEQGDGKPKAPLIPNADGATDGSENLPPPPPPPVLPPSTDSDPGDDEGGIVDETGIFDGGEDEEEELEYCPEPKIHKKKRGEEECARLMAGELPADHDFVEGQLQFELSAEDEDVEEAFERVERVLKEETAVIAAGCSKKKKRRWLQDDGNSTADLLSISAVDFDRFQTRDACVSGGASDCDTVRTTVEVYYEGDRKATDEEKEEMFMLVIETIEEQAKEGAFGNYTSLNYLEASIASSDFSRGPDAATTSGIAVGAVVAACVLVGGIVYYKRRKGASGTQQTSPRPFV